jgi:uncharacterized coiled-coil DUF342 family protein
VQNVARSHKSVFHYHVKNIKEDNMNTKEAYEQKIQAQVDEWDAEILKLKAQASKTTAEVQINMNNQIKELRKKKEAVNEKLTQLKEASEDSWVDLKAGIEEGLDLLKTTVDSIISRYK